MSDSSSAATGGERAKEMEEVLARFLRQQQKQHERDHEHHRSASPSRSSPTSSATASASASAAMTRTTQTQYWTYPPRDPTAAQEILPRRPPHHPLASEAVPSPQRSPRRANRGAWVSDATTQTTADVGTQTPRASPSPEPEAASVPRQRAASAAHPVVCSVDAVGSAAAVASPPMSLSPMSLSPMSLSPTFGRRQSQAHAPKSPTIKAVPVHVLEAEGHRRSCSDTTSPLIFLGRVSSAEQQSIRPRQSSSHFKSAQMVASASAHNRSFSDSVSPKKPAAVAKSPLAPTLASPSLTYVSSPKIPRAHRANPNVSTAASGLPVVASPPPAYWSGQAVQSSLDDIEEELFRITQRALNIGRELKNHRAQQSPSPALSASPVQSPSMTPARPRRRVSALAPCPMKMLFGSASDDSAVSDEGSRIGFFGDPEFPRDSFVVDHGMQHGIMSAREDAVPLSRFSAFQRSTGSGSSGDEC